MFSSVSHGRPGYLKSDWTDTVTTQQWKAVEIRNSKRNGRLGEDTAIKIVNQPWSTWSRMALTSLTKRYEILEYWTKGEYLSRRAWVEQPAGGALQQKKKKNVKPNETHTHTHSTYLTGIMESKYDRAQHMLGSVSGLNAQPRQGQAKSPEGNPGYDCHPGCQGTTHTWTWNETDEWEAIWTPFTNN